ncbi:glycoside hydrolase family 6 protein [Macrolepiota fuliginosa MF-IS2]|uniref:Glucanase n=1 Tax=Macrolepiota fuliginosa MF-IS2 TaxID=1400762 RepID=A0A9P5X5I3_9AGAR|nr:glycoside hydrolase family 6 protein [Macrolepiota fuliginosa MF-IS2]
MFPRLPLLTFVLGALSLSYAAPSRHAHARGNLDNPFVGYTQYANSNYATEVEQTVQSLLAKNDTLNAARARTVKDVSTFLWIDSVANISRFETQLTEAVRKQSATGAKYIFPFVIYNLPDRDCSAAASAGEFSVANQGEQLYRQFVDRITSIVQAHSKADQHLQFAIIVEPDSIGNIVTNTGVAKCAGAADAYERGIAYVIEQLGRLPNVALYLDAAHSNWLGWPGNLEPTAAVFADILSIANGNQTNPTNPAKIRGFSTNVSNYNGYNPTTPDPIYGAGPDNPNWSEFRYAQALQPFLEARGLPAHFIIDQGRSGQQNIRSEGGNWCNVNNAGYGIRPTTETGEDIVDALVWVKPGGESDGTSDETAARFDSNCVGPNAKIPAPEAGTWFNDYVEMLVQNANPPLDPTY